MELHNSHKTKMIYSPEHHIPIFEAITTESGAVAVRIKRNKVYEVITLDSLLMLVLRETATLYSAESPLRGSR